MAKQGLIRIPYYPQLSCLNDLHPAAARVMSALLYWMSRGRNAAVYCPKRHDYQLSLHLCVSVEDLRECLRIFKELRILSEREELVKRRDVANPKSKDRFETRLVMDFNALTERLRSAGLAIEKKHLLHAADDAFDFYDVIDLKNLPLRQSLLGTVRSDSFEKAAYLASAFMIRLNERREDLAADGIAPGWKLLLALPAHMSEEEYAGCLAERFLRKGERAIDFSLSDGNVFIPDHDEIMTPEHVVRHYRKQRESVTIAAALMLYLNSVFAEELTFMSELGVSDLKDAMELCREITGTTALLKDGYFRERRLTEEEELRERALYAAFADEQRRMEE